MSEIVDVSMPLHPGMAHWPGSLGMRLARRQTMAAGGDSDASTLTLDVHAGTHVDAPAHYLPGGATAETLPLDVLVGEAHVAHIPEATAVTAQILQALDIPSGVTRLLLRTRNSDHGLADHPRFDPGYAAVTPDAARWLTARPIRLLGVDYLSAAPFDDPAPTHRILLETGMVVLEGLRLGSVQPGPWELLCLPLLLPGADGSPARTLLRRPVNGHNGDGRRP